MIIHCLCWYVRIGLGGAGCRLGREQNKLAARAMTALGRILERQLMAGCTSSRRGQEADFQCKRCDGPAAGLASPVSERTPHTGFYPPALA